MSKRFNSGMGGYTCDRCGVLMWAGMKDKIYCYKLEEKDIVEYEGSFFCSGECVEGFKLDSKVSNWKEHDPID